MGKAQTAVDPEKLYRVTMNEKHSIGPLKLRPGQEAVLSGTAIIEAGAKVSVIAEVGG